MENIEFNSEDKSLEQLRYEDLIKQSSSMPLESDYTLVENEEEILDEEDYSMRGDFLASDHPEKIAMFRLQEAKANLHALEALLYVLSQAKLEDREKFEAMLKQKIALLKPILKRLVLPMPQTREDAKDLSKEIISFKNWKTLSDIVEIENKI
jgi:hypothetical protein